MKASDTVLDEMTRTDIFYHGAGTLEAVCLVQANISFKAGIKEVVEWVRLNTLSSFDDKDGELLVFGVDDWQAQLKAWGIEKPTTEDN